MKATLPWPTLALIALTDFLKGYWWLLVLGVVAVIVALQRYRRTERGTKTFDTWAIRMPLFGPLGLKTAMARFTRTLGILLQSSIPLLDALDISRAVLNNSILSKAIEDAKELIREGSDIATPLRNSGYFPPLVSHMISIGEQSGQLEDMLIRVADTYDNDVQMSIEGLTSLIDPLIMVLMGAFIFGIMLAILLPIFEMNSAVR
jgi:general secretion pathway protein F